MRQFRAQIRAGWWKAVDLTRKGLLDNFFDDAAPSPWLVCSLILTGTPERSGGGWAGCPDARPASKHAILAVYSKASLGLPRGGSEGAGGSGDGEGAE